MPDRNLNPRFKGNPKRLRITGEVVEILTGATPPVAKVFLKTCSIEIPLSSRIDLHLGDCVEIEAELRIRRVVPRGADSKPLP